MRSSQFSLPGRAVSLLKQMLALRLLYNQTRRYVEKISCKNEQNFCAIFLDNARQLDENAPRP
jgi:hypothetical protein